MKERDTRLCLWISLHLHIYISVRLSVGDVTSLAYIGLYPTDMCAGVGYHWGLPQASSRGEQLSAVIVKHPYCMSHNWNTTLGNVACHPKRGMLLAILKGKYYLSP